jgi:beta-lactamase class A
MGTLARLGVAVELLRRVDLGQFRLEETLDAVTARSSEQGAETDENATLTLSAACARMLAAEEPVAIEATAVLIELVGLGETNETLSRLKLEATHLTREEDGGRARASHRESTTTAGDMLTLLGLLSGSAIPGAAQLRGTLARQARESAVRAVLPLEAELAHLPDIAGRHAHDVGWMRGPGGGCAFCVLIADMDDTDRAKRALEGVLRLFWSVWCAG